MATPYPTRFGVTFKLIDRLHGYAFGDDGSMWSRRIRGHTVPMGDWRPIRGHLRDDGYVEINVKVDGRRRSYRLHRLILEAFVGPCPPGMEARHLNDNDRSNNRLGNLGWGTAKQNTADRRRHGTLASGERSGAAKIDRGIVAEMYDLFESGLLIREIAERFNYDPSMTSKVLRGRYWADALPGRRPPLAGLDARQRGAIMREQRRRTGT